MPRRFPSRPEHVPVAAYHLLRQLDEGPVDSATLFGKADKYAVQFLTSRKLALLAGSVLTITPRGSAIGEVGDELSTIVSLGRPFAPRPVPRARTRQVGATGVAKPLSETLLDAAQNIDQLSPAHILILIRQAVRVLQLAEGEAGELALAANDDSYRPHVTH